MGMIWTNRTSGCEGEAEWVLAEDRCWWTEQSPGPRATHQDVVLLGSSTECLVPEEESAQTYVLGGIPPHGCSACTARMRTTLPSHLCEAYCVLLSLSLQPPNLWPCSPPPIPPPLPPPQLTSSCAPPNVYCLCPLPQQVFGPSGLPWHPQPLARCLALHIFK